MAKWSFWDWLGYTCLGVAAVGLAIGTATKDAEMLSQLPAFFTSPRWGYVPMALFTLGSVVLAIQHVAPLFQRSPSAIHNTVSSEGPEGPLEWKFDYRILDLGEPNLVAAWKSKREAVNESQTVMNQYIQEMLKAVPNSSISDINKNLEIFPSEMAENLRSLREKHARLSLSSRSAYYQLETDVLAGLADGRLVAQGFPLPISKDSAVERIPRERWRFLEFSEKYTKAEGEGIAYSGIEVAKAK